MCRPVRRQLLVDPKVQGALAVRVAVYWGYCMLTVALLGGCWIALTDAPASGSELVLQTKRLFVPVLAGSMIALPMVVIDCMRLTNRFAGPMYRLKNQMQRLADGEAVEPVKFRDGDYWQEFADQFNRVVQRLQELEPATQDDTPESIATVENSTDVAEEELASV